MAGEPLDLLVVADHAGGGLGVAAAAHARWFAERGWVVALAAPHVVPEDVAPAEAQALPPVTSIFEIGAVLRAAALLRRLLRERRPRVVHVHGTRSQLVTLLAGRVPYVTMHGGGRVEGQGALGSAVRRLARRLAARLAVRAYTAAPASGRWRTLLHASPRLAGLDQAPVPTGEVPMFLWVGRMDVPKRPDVFVDACASASRLVALRGVMLGDGPQLEQVRARASDLDAPVDILGRSDDVESQLRQATAVCLFSGFEGVPFAVQEAMWAGRAVVLSPLPSLRWFAGDAATYAEDATEAASAFRALAHAATAATRGAAAAERVRSRLTPDAPFPALLADYRDLSAMTDR